MKNRGFTIIEILVASTISAIFLVSVSSAVFQIFSEQKKTNISQDFFAESRFLTEKVVREIRENTVDYDQFFLESGPSCANFSARQSKNSAGNCSGTIENNPTNRKNLENFPRGYPGIFFWDTDCDENRTQDRHLGGKKLEESSPDDDCTIAFHKTDGKIDPHILFLINGDRTMRTAIKKSDPENLENPDQIFGIEIQKKIGADENEDGKIDLWGFWDFENICENESTENCAASFCSTGNDQKIFWDENDTICKICKNDGTVSIFPVVDKKSFSADDRENFCKSSHDFTKISPPQILVEKFEFDISPARDPFLAFRVGSAQIHPQILLSISTKLNSKINFEKTPEISIQTAASSRIYGDVRK